MSFFSLSLTFRLLVSHSLNVLLLVLFGPCTSTAHRMLLNYFMRINMK